MEDMSSRPGQADRSFLQCEIAPVLGYAQEDPPRKWVILTQFHFTPDFGEKKRIERLLPAAAEAGAPMRIRVLYLAARGSPTLVRAELARLARDMERYYPNCETSVVLGEMPFEDEVSSFGSYFDKKTFSVKNEKGSE